MSKMKAGFIGFMPFGNSDVDIYALLESYAKLGYKGFENGDILFRDGDPVENLKRVQSFGIQPLTLGYMNFPGRPAPTVSELAEKAHKIGVKNVVTYVGVVGMHRFGANIEKPTYDQIMKEIETFENLAAELAKEGINFAFHNHDCEFTTTYRGVPAFYLMAANSEHLKFELDVGWCAYAGCDPVRVINELGDRLFALHIKDFAEGKVEQKRPDGSVNVMPRFTTPGTGKLDLAGCLKAGLDLGLEWAIVEQDFQFNLTQYETLNAAYLNMKETGFVE